ncbi:MAG: DUF3883 domain-containing protein [Kiritimatiellae bacterium]|nr:DUF3883 domain-containing protein [Kiritimatiellia bacterium]
MLLNHTDKATLAGLYLSKFGKAALSALGCTGVWQAFNVIGYSLESRPASIKNYRDEFDNEIRKTNPHHPREGWKRPLKTRSKKLYEQFCHSEFDEFTVLIKSFLLPTFKKEKLIAQVTNQEINQNFSQRLMTGQAAEAYFKVHYPSISAFVNYGIEDVTSCGCGYDFHLSLHSDFYCVEVKGLGANTGTILMTEKEYEIADRIRDRYCLFVVRNFQRTPWHTLFFNPLSSGLEFVPQPQTVMNYTVYMTGKT